MTIRLRQDQKHTRIDDATAMYRIMREVLLREKGIDKNRERLWVASLAFNRTLLNLELITIGGTNVANIEASAVFSIALQKDSKAIMLIHNHPSGKPEPSFDDNNLTELMCAIGELLRCPVIDHLIIGDKGFYSYENQGHLQKLRGLTNASDPRPEKEVARLKIDLIDSRDEAAAYKRKVERLNKEIKRLKSKLPKS